MPRARFWIICALAALMAILGFLLMRVKFWTPDEESLKNMLPANVDMRLDNLVLSEAGAADRSMVINADRAQYYKTQDLFILEEVAAHITTDQGDYDIKAASGRYEMDLRLVELMGRIRASDERSRVLVASRLLFNVDAGCLQSLEPFTLTAPDSSLSGRSFTFYTQDRLLRVDGPVNLVLK